MNRAARTEYPDAPGRTAYRGAEGVAYTSSSARGAASELVACAWLLERGWHVCRSVSPSCPFDGIAWRDGVALRFEVKTLSLTLAHQAGTLGFARYPGATFTAPGNNEWDLLLVVGPADVHSFGPEDDRDDMIDMLRRHYGLAPRVINGVSYRC